MGRESLAQFIGRTDTRWIVTMNSFNYRKIYDDSVLEALYLHDLDSAVGDEIEIDGVHFTKALTNPVFAAPSSYHLDRFDGLNHGTRLRVYGDWNPLWKRHHPLWNSVYRMTAAVERAQR